MAAAHLQLWRLEPRQTPTNNVVAEVIGPDLWIRGDDAANGLSVLRLRSGAFRLEGGVDAATQETTTVNGLSAFITARVGGHVRVELGGGDDYLLLGDDAGRPLRAPADFAVDTGDGADFVIGAASAAGALTIDTGPGDDYVEGRLAAGRGLTVRTGAGDDRILWEGGRSRTAEISAGEGDQDLVYVGATAHTGDVAVAGDLTISQAELVSFNNPALQYVSATRVGGDLSVRADGVTGQVDMTRVRVERDLGVATGSGNDAVNLSGVRARNLSVETGDGDDFIAFGGSGRTADVTVRENLTVRSGAGNDFINFNLFFDAGAASNTRVGRWAHIEAGSGDDQVESYTLRPAGGLLIETGDGDDDTAVVDSRVRILVVSLGTGDDSLALAWTRTDGLADGGPGADRLLQTGGRNSIAGLTRTGFEEEG